MPKHFRRRRLQGGIVQVFETDSDGDYLRHLIDELAEDFGLACNIAVLQRPEGWLLVRVEENAAGETAGVERGAPVPFHELVGKLDRAFGSFYECAEFFFWGRASGWRVRHRPGRRWI